MAKAKKAKEAQSGRKNNAAAATTNEVQDALIGVTDELRHAATTYLGAVESLYEKLEEHEISDIHLRCSSPELATELAEELRRFAAGLLKQSDIRSSGALVQISIHDLLPDFLSELATVISTTHLPEVQIDPRLLKAAESFLKIYANPTILLFESDSSITDHDLAPALKSFHQRKEWLLKLLLGAESSPHSQRLTIEAGPRFFLGGAEIKPGYRAKGVICTLGLLGSQSFSAQAFSELYEGNIDPDRRVFGNHMQVLKDELSLSDLNWRIEKNKCFYSGLSVRLNISRQDAEAFLRERRELKAR